MLRRVLIVLFIILVVLGFILFRNIGPTFACSLRATSKFQPGLSLHTITSGGTRRCYWLVIPESSSGSNAMAVVFSLHGFASNPRGQRSYSQWDRAAAPHQAVLVYPQGSGFPLRWNALPGAYPGSPDDVLFIKDLLVELEAALPIDPERIYLTGFSNGGSMTLRLLCEAGELFAAAGTVSTPVTESIAACTMDHALPLIAFHGTDDPVVDYKGWVVDASAPGDGPARPFQRETVLGFETWTRIWAEKSGCKLPSETLSEGEGVIERRYRGCVGGTMLEAFTISGGGHTWPGGRPIPFVGMTSKAISASETMWEFFESQAR
jgi:polyhydroxybutyrate depolymerase